MRQEREKRAMKTERDRGTERGEDKSSLNLEMTTSRVRDGPQNETR